MKPRVWIRDDDVGVKPNHTIHFKRDIGLFVKYKVKRMLGLVLQNNHTKEIRHLLKSGLNKNRWSLELHGIKHCVYSHMSYKLQLDHLEHGRDRIKEWYGVYPEHFIAPGGFWNKDTIKACDNVGLSTRFMYYYKKDELIAGMKILRNKEEWKDLYEDTNGLDYLVVLHSSYYIGSRFNDHSHQEKLEELLKFITKNCKYDKI